MPRSRKWQLAPVFLPGTFHGLRLQRVSHDWARTHWKENLRFQIRFAFEELSCVNVTGEKKQTCYEKSFSIFFKEYLREMNIQTLSWVRAAGQTPRTRRGPTENASDGIQEVNSTQRIILYSLSKKSTVKHLANEGQYSTFWRGLRATKTQLGNTICK